MATAGIETILQARIMLVLHKLESVGISPPRASVQQIKRIGCLPARPGATIRRMIDLGFLEEHRELEPTLYSLTSSGREALLAWSESKAVSA